MSRLEAVVLCLYVNGEQPLTVLSRSNLQRLRQLVGPALRFEVVDVLDDPARAERERILVTPTLVRVSPPPPLRVGGDLSDVEAALDGLGIRPWQHREGART